MYMSFRTAAGRLLLADALHVYVISDSSWKIIVGWCLFMLNCFF